MFGDFKSIDTDHNNSHLTILVFLFFIFLFCLSTKSWQQSNFKVRCLQSKIDLEILNVLIVLISKSSLLVANLVFVFFCELRKVRMWPSDFDNVCLRHSISTRSLFFIIDPKAKKEETKDQIRWIHFFISIVIKLKIVWIWLQFNIWKLRQKNFEFVRCVKFWFRNNKNEDIFVKLVFFSILNSSNVQSLDRGELTQILPKLLLLFQLSIGLSFFLFLTTNKLINLFALLLSRI